MPSAAYAVQVCSQVLGETRLEDVLLAPIAYLLASIPFFSAIVHSISEHRLDWTWQMSRACKSAYIHAPAQ
eukprot:6741020-Lingulodinium_polyedra.AAC.1